MAPGPSHSTDLSDVRHTAAALRPPGSGGARVTAGGTRLAGRLVVARPRSSVPPNKLLRVADQLLEMAAVALALAAVARVPTQGAAGFKFFTSPTSGAPLLASAHFWDGKSPDMAARSTLHALSADPLATGNLTVAALQSFPTKGAHGWDFFTHGAASFAVVCSYYGCGSERGPAPAACRSTTILRHDAASDAFVEHQALATAGPAQTSHLLTSTGAAYLLVGENFNDEVCVYRLSSTTALFERDGACLPVPGAGAVAAAEVAGHLYLAAASYHDAGWRTTSRVFRAPLPRAGDAAAPLAWALHQRIPTHGAHDAELATLAGVTYLFLAEDRSDASTRVTSALLALQPATGLFEEVQRLPTDGAQGGALFLGPAGQPCLAVANFGDRLGGRYAARSQLWCRSASASGAFERAAEVRTQGATDVEHWVWRGRHYLAIAEEGDLSRRAWQRSFIYELRAAAGAAEAAGEAEL
jgi:hypothetical protein